ncbi:MAG: hypothetical protein GY724_00760, partial [Actinomycetia bacterium]|nr:hypothetical protein [Actinomycetes bacterium]
RPSALVSSFPQLLSITHCDHYKRSLSARLATLRRLTRLPGRLLLRPLALRGADGAEQSGDKVGEVEAVPVIITVEGSSSHRRRK